MNKGAVIYAANPNDCASCPLHAQCTDAKQRFITRHAYEGAFERMATRLADHPFGNIKQWIMGNGRF